MVKGLKMEIPENVHFIGRVEHKNMRASLARSSFYLQLSMSEGFPNAICEAMLCECVPIGSAVNAIPEIISDTGFILEKRNVEELATLLEKAFESDTDTLGLKARERISAFFPRNRREEDLLAALED